MMALLVIRFELYFTSIKRSVLDIEGISGHTAITFVSTQQIGIIRNETTKIAIQVYERALSFGQNEIQYFFLTV